MLLDHSSGIAATNNDPAFLRAWIGADAGAASAWTSADFLDLAARAAPAGAPGRGHWYGDANYILLGELVAAVANEPLRAHVARTLLEPLAQRSAHSLSARPPDAPPPVLTARGYLRFSEPLAGLFDPARFPEVAPGLFDTTVAGERIDGASALVMSAPDLLRFADAVWRGELLSAASRARLRAAADGLDAAEIGARRQGIVTARRTPHGVVLTSEGDGPGGSSTLVAFHPPTGTLVVGLVTHFGGWDEHDFLVGEVVAAAITPR
jgi:CubicO group peptidase (beta-lactamase class C family)